MSMGRCYRAAGEEKAGTVNDKAEFEVIGIVQRAVHGPKVSRLNIKAQLARDAYVDVVSFTPLRNVERRYRVKVLGHISAEKAGQKESGKNGQLYDKWLTMLVADQVEVLDDGQSKVPGTDPEPRARPRVDDDIPF